MNAQTYLMVNEVSNIVENTCVWDGDPTHWQPPAGFLMLIQDETPAKIWGLNASETDYVLVEKMGAGGIDYVWDGVFVVTNQSKPPAPIPPTV